MRTFLDSDLRDIFNHSRMMERVMFAPKSGTAREKSMLWNDPRVEKPTFEKGSGGSVQSSAVVDVLTCTGYFERDEKDPEKEDEVEKDGKTYEVKETLKTGYGQWTLYLREIEKEPLDG